MTDSVVDSPHVDIRVVHVDEQRAWLSIDDILGDAFGPDALPSVPSLRDLVARGSTEDGSGSPVVFGAFTDGELIGLSCSELFERERTWYLWAIVTRRDWRGKGVGRSMLAHMQARVAAESAGNEWAPRWIVAESDAPSDRDEHSLEIRRLRFYLGSGFSIAPIEFMSPPWEAQSTQPWPYWIVEWVAPDGEGTLDLASVVQRIAAGSVLSGPSPMAADCIDFSMDTIGREPRLAPAMREAWSKRRRS